MSGSGETPPIVDAAKIRFAGVERYDLSTALVLETKPFLSGSLNRVNFKRKDGSDKTVYAWVPELDSKTGKSRGSVEFFANLNELIPFVSMKATTRKDNILLRMQPVDLISGLIAILMTATMIFIVVDQVLSRIPIKPRVYACRPLRA
jgi:hypothetical protein